MRFVSIALLIAVAVAAGLVAWGALSNLWSDYRDSPVSTYLLIGIPSLLVALAALVGAGRLWRRDAR